MRRRQSGGMTTGLTLWGWTLLVLVFPGLVAAGCSGTPAAQTGSSAGGREVVATFTAVHPDASTLELTADATVVTARLHLLGDAAASAAVRGRTIVVVGARRLPVPVDDLVAPGVFQIRPALCQSGPYAVPASGAVTSPLPSGCSSERYSLQIPNLTVDESTGNSNLGSIAPDPALASYPSSSAAYSDSHPQDPVLLPAIGGGGARYLLGPADLNGTAVASAGAVFEDPVWVVNVTFTGTGASEWDAVAKRYFHELVGMDVDGQALSVPLIQPSQSTFASFAGKVQISGNFTGRTAEQLAAVLGSGPLVTPLQS
jgi:preprotein translocase subunit SecD